MMGGREAVPAVGTQLAEAAWGQESRAWGQWKGWGRVAGWGTAPTMGTEMASGRGLPTVALFPAGAENFASIGAARERETSTPGYRPSLQRRGGQQGGPCPQHFPTMSPLCTTFTAHHSSAAHRPSPCTHCPTCAVHSTIPSRCHSHILPSRTATPCPWSCWPHRCSIHTCLRSAVHLSLGLDPPSLCPS